MNKFTSHHGMSIVLCISLLLALAATTTLYVTSMSVHQGNIVKHTQQRKVFAAKSRSKHAYLTSIIPLLVTQKSAPLPNEITLLKHYTPSNRRVYRLTIAHSNQRDWVQDIATEPFIKNIPESAITVGGKIISQYRSHTIVAPIKQLKNTQPHDTNPSKMLFNLSPSQWHLVKDFAPLHAVSCDDLDNTSSGLIWIAGKCTTHLLQDIGSELAPVIMIIDEGYLHMRQGVTIYGIVILLTASDITSAHVEVTGTATIDGALMATDDLILQGQPLSMNNNLGLLSRLRELPSLQVVYAIPGSWRDF